MTKLTKYQFCKLYEMSSGISSKSEQSGHGSPFLSFSTVFNNYFIPDDLPDLMDVSDKEKEKYSILKGDIFLTRTSEVVDELAMSSVALKDYPDATYSGFLKRLRPLQDDVTYYKYMAFYLRGDLFRRSMNNNAVLTLRASLNENIFSYLYLILPDYSEQVKIGDLLHLLNDKIILNNRMNAELESIAKILYDYWFVQFDFPGKDSKPYKSSGGMMVYDDCLKRKIPEDWKPGTLEELGEIVGGSTPSTKTESNFSQNGIPWITPNDLSNNLGNKYIAKGSIDITLEGFKSASLNLYPQGTILLSSRAPIGYMAIARNPLTTNQGFKSFIPSKEFSTEFVFYAVKNSMKAITQHASGSTFKEISGTVLKSIKICLPPNEIVCEYTRRVESIFARQNLLEQENDQLIQLRDWLLPMLMNGQVTVK
jgi:type I restriction enzyme, S subunit